MKTSRVGDRSGHFELDRCRAVDGDTLDCIIHVGFGMWIQKKVRLKGWFASELNGPNPGKAELAKLRLQEAVEDHEPMILSHSLREDKYGRIVALLLLDGKVASPSEVLGDCEISESQHQTEHAWIRAQAGGRRGSL